MTRPDGQPPGGLVTFTDGGTVLGTVAPVNGVATLATSALEVGDHQLTATFTGEGYDTSSGTARAHVEPVAAPAKAISISAADAFAKEGTPPKKKKKGKPKRKKLTFTITLSGASSTPVSVAFTTKDGTAKAGKDYVATKGTLKFAAGQTKLTVTVQVIPDKKKEKNEKFSLVLSSPQGATLARAVAIGTIKDDDKSKRRR